MLTFFRKGLPKRSFLPKTDGMSVLSAQISLAPLTEQDDESLMKLYQKGNEEAFQILISRYHQPLFQFILRFMGNWEQAEECFQEVFLRVVRARQDFKTSKKFKTWLYTIARHYCIDALRKKKFRNHSSLDQITAEHPQHEPASALPGADEEVGSHQFEGFLEKVLEQINPEQREVFVLREMQRLSFDEISRVVGAPLNTVKSRMRYALASIRKIFEASGLRSDDL